MKIAIRVIAVILLSTVAVTRQKPDSPATSVVVVSVRSEGPAKVEGFTISQDGQAAQLASGITPGTALPVEIVVVVDTSTSAARSKLFAPNQNAALALVKALQDSGTAVRAAVVTADTQITVVQGLTNDMHQLEAALERIRPGGASRIQDALYGVCQKMFAGPIGSARRIALLLSDGDDNQSNYTRDEVIALAQERGVLIYALSTGQPAAEYEPLAGRGAAALRKLTSETGGIAYLAKKPSDLQQIDQLLEKDIHNQFLIEFLPLFRDGKPHHIEVKSTNKSVRVRSASKYFAPK